MQFEVITNGNGFSSPSIMVAQKCCMAMSSDWWPKASVHYDRAKVHVQCKSRGRKMGRERTGEPHKVLQRQSCGSWLTGVLEAASQPAVKDVAFFGSLLWPVRERGDDGGERKEMEASRQRRIWKIGERGGAFCILYYYNLFILYCCSFFYFRWSKLSFFYLSIFFSINCCYLFKKILFYFLNYF